MEGQIITIYTQNVTFNSSFCTNYKALRDFRGSFLYNTAFNVGKCQIDHPL